MQHKAVERKYLGPSPRKYGVQHKIGTPLPYAWLYCENLLFSLKTSLKARRFRIPSVVEFMLF